GGQAAAPRGGAAAGGEAQPPGRPHEAGLFADREGWRQRCLEQKFEGSDQAAAAHHHQGHQRAHQASAHQGGEVCPQPKSESLYADRPGAESRDLRRHMVQGRGVQFFLGGDSAGALQDLFGQESLAPRVPVGPPSL
ncbi:unnamed protein product, partial [Effrenium voratum]